MPIYLYKCAQGHQVELSHGMGQTINVHCAVCGNTLRRVFTVPAIKGSSFIEPSPAIKNFLSTSSERRDKFEAKKAARGE